MDNILALKRKVGSFRVKELKEVLGQLGLVKQGRKQDLVDRVFALLSGDEDMDGAEKQMVEKVIDDTYRKMLDNGVTSSSPGGPSGSDRDSIMPKEEIIDSFIVDQEIRCPCGSSLPTDFMIQCADLTCHVSQHIRCVIPRDSLEGIPPVPSQFFCDICRIKRSDPFWVTLAHPLLPVKLRTSEIPVDDSIPVKNLEREFQITKADIHLLENGGYDVQAWCILLNDSVPFRLQWPQYPDLKVNGIPVKTVSRPGSKVLGANGRDESPSISMYLVEGCNRISLTCSDSRSFCFGVRLAKQRTIHQVLNLIPSEHDGEAFFDALARVRRCIGGGMAATKDDSDSDLEVIADAVTVNLRCPMSGSRMLTAGRFKACMHMGCFDLKTFIQLNERSKKWQCPICLKNYALDDIVIDPYFNRILKMMQHCEEDITEIEVKADGTWRANIGHPFMNLEKWHLPDGSVHVYAVKDDSLMECINAQSNPISSMKKNKDGFSHVKIPHNVEAFSAEIYLEDSPKHCEQEIITMSNRAESAKDDGSQNMNQYGTSHFDRSINDCEMMNCMSWTSGITKRSSPASFGDASVIILSDSEEENDILVSRGTISVMCPSTGNSSSECPGTPASHMEDPAMSAALSHPSMKVKGGSSQISNSEASNGPFTFRRQPRTMRKSSCLNNRRVEGAGHVPSWME